MTIKPNTRDKIPAYAQSRAHEMTFGMGYIIGAVIGVLAFFGAIDKGNTFAALISLLITPAIYFCVYTSRKNSVEKFENDRFAKIETTARKEELRIKKAEEAAAKQKAEWEAGAPERERLAKLKAEEDARLEREEAEEWEREAEERRHNVETILAKLDADVA